MDGHLLWAFTPLGGISNIFMHGACHLPYYTKLAVLANINFDFIGYKKVSVFYSLVVGEFMKNSIGEPEPDLC